MSFYTEPNSNRSIRPVKICYYKDLEDTNGVGAPKLAAKNDFIALKAEVD